MALCVCRLGMESPCPAPAGPDGLCHPCHGCPPDWHPTAAPAGHDADRLIRVWSEMAHAYTPEGVVIVWRSRHGWLDDRTPSDVWRTDPARVEAWAQGLGGMMAS